jgi:hypothetical protein
MAAHESPVEKNLKDHCVPRGGTQTTCRSLLADFEDRASGDVGWMAPNCPLSNRNALLGEDE